MQLHVLSYSLHHLLRALSTPPTSSSTSSSTSTSSSSCLLNTGDLDPCLDLISDILKEDLFGTAAEERESGAGVAKIPESKTPQSFNTYEIVAQFISPKLVPQLLAPIKEVYFLNTLPIPVCGYIPPPPAVVYNLFIVCITFGRRTLTLNLRPETDFKLMVIQRLIMRNTSYCVCFVACRKFLALFFLAFLSDVGTTLQLSYKPCGGGGVPSCSSWYPTQPGLHPPGPARLHLWDT